MKQIDCRRCERRLGETDGENISLAKRPDVGKADLAIKKHGFGIICICGFETLWLYGKQKSLEK